MTNADSVLIQCLVYIFSGNMWLLDNISFVTASIIILYNLSLIQ